MGTDRLVAPIVGGIVATGADVVVRAGAADSDASRSRAALACVVCPVHWTALVVVVVVMVGVVVVDG